MGFNMKNKGLRACVLLATSLCVAPVFAADAGGTVSDLVALIKADVKRADAAQAIINYRAKSDYNDAVVRRDELLADAPGTADMLASSEQLKAILAAENAPTASAARADSQIMGLLGNGGLDRATLAKEYFDNKMTPNALNLNRFLDTSLLVDDAGKKQLTATESLLFGKLFMANAEAIPIDVAPDAGSGRALSVLALLSPNVAAVSHMRDIRVPPTGLKVSKMSVWENESQRRFLDPDGAWAAKVAVTPPAGLLRELVHMEAFKLYLEMERYKQLERVEALLASSNVLSGKALPILVTVAELLRGMEAAKNTNKVSQ